MKGSFAAERTWSLVARLLRAPSDPPRAPAAHFLCAFRAWSARAPSFQVLSEMRNAVCLAVLGKSEVVSLCGREDLNLHDLTATSPSS